LLCLVLTGCEDTESPVLPTELTLVSGDGQFSKRGTSLVDALEVRLGFSDGAPAGDYNVRFQVTELGGTLSRTTVSTSGSGRAASRLTLPDQTGVVRVRASLDGNSDVYVDFTATSAEYYCPEEDPNVSNDFTSNALVFNDLFLVTAKSSLFGGAGVIRVEPAAGAFDASPLLSFPQTITDKTVRDAAFSAAGAYFIAWTFERDEVIRVQSDLSYGRFSELKSFFGSEITMTPMGILVGCDEFGPFTIGCRDTLARFEDATYPGFLAGDYANNDAVAVDPATEDIYYIRVPLNKLMRLPVDTLLATGLPEEVVDLTEDEAEGASGMEVDGRDGAVYILVDTDDTRSIVKVTAGGVKSTVVDFLTHPVTSGAPGRQNDLALDRQFRFLFTLDRQNDVLLLYNIPLDELTILSPNLTTTDAEALSTATSAEERVGLVVLPPRL
jgi:hypothetical protein